MADGTGYEGTGRIHAGGSRPGGDRKDAREVTVEGPAHAAIHVFLLGCGVEDIYRGMSAPDQLALRLFPYPAWKVEVNGRVVETAAREGTGQMLVPVEAGMNRVQITFFRTWDRTAGGWISFVTVLCLALLGVASATKTHDPGPSVTS